MEEKDFRKRLIEERKLKGLTQEEVAEMCNITVRTIQRIESGAVVPRAFTIKSISEVLGFSFFDASDTGCDDERRNEDSILEEHTIMWYLKDLFNLKTNAMKKVSILTTAFLTIGFSLFFFVSGMNAKSVESKHPIDEGKPLSTHYINTKDRIEVAFSNALTFDSLVYIKEELKARNITLNYKVLKFEGGKLFFIDCEVDCNDGFKGSFSIGLDSLNKKERFGFYRDYSGKTKSVFGTGKLN